MRTHLAIAAAAGLAALTSLAAAGGSAAAAEPGETADHGHILLLDVEVEPNSFPPRPTSVRACLDLAAGQPVPRSDHLHVDFDGGSFTERTGHVIVPVWPYEPLPGQPVPWRDCAEFLAMLGLG
jgi:hypothetical protein